VVPGADRYPASAVELGRRAPQSAGHTVAGRQHLHLRWTGVAREFTGLRGDIIDAFIEPAAVLGVARPKDACGEHYRRALAGTLCNKTGR
jgi:hypothetical protein